MTDILRKLLSQVASLRTIHPKKGAFNIRTDGKMLTRGQTENVTITSKTEKAGLNIHVKKNSKNVLIHIPVLLSRENFTDILYNDFYIGDNSDVLMIAGCGIHNTSKCASVHNSFHNFYVGENCHIKYIEKHLGLGNLLSIKEMSPSTMIELGKGSIFEMQTSQIGGITKAIRKISATLQDDARLTINENVLTAGKDVATIKFYVDLVGKNSKADVISHSVARDDSKQSFISLVKGKNVCFGHVECDGILSDNGVISSSPAIVALDPNASLVHEAAIGRISEEQENKLMTLGLTKEQAEKTIIKGFLR